METKQIEVYFLPVEGNFKDYISQTPGINESDFIGIVDMYMKKYSDAWNELAKK